MRDIGQKKRLTTFLTHLLFIILIFVLPEVLTSIASPWKAPNPWVYFKSLLFMVVFYANYFFIIERTLGRGKNGLWKFILYNVALTAAVLTINYVVWRVMTECMPARPHRHRRPDPTELQILARSALFFVRDFVIIVLTIGLSVALRMGDKWLNLEKRSREIMSIKREEELKNLKSQLNPHFLFNTLNSIYALIAISPDKAQQAVHELSRLLRYVLYENPAEVVLSQDLAFVDNYIGLMRLRLRPDLKLNVTLDAADSANDKIAPLLFITVVENVFKHGNTGNAADGIEISITAREGLVVCRTVNTVAERGDESSRRTGIGEQNLRRRLDLLYGQNASFVSRREGDIYITELKIQLNHTGHGN